MNPTIRIVAIGILITLIARSSNADTSIPALSLPGGQQSAGTPTADSIHGWKFVANEAIQVTQLGLYDLEGDGFLIDHPIGLFRFSDGQLLTSGTLLTGVSRPLIANFRYVDTPDVMLNLGESYVVAFYTSTRLQDLMVTGPVGLATNSAITFTAALFSGSNMGSFTMPTSLSNGQHRIGPNFLFDTIPEPSAFCLALLSFAGIGSVRIKR